MPRHPNSLANLKINQLPGHACTNPRGRPPKFVSEIASITGGTDGQITECLRVLISLQVSELEELLKHPRVTALEKIVGRALLDDIKEYKQFNLHENLRLLIARPKETIDITANVTHTTNFTLPGGSVIDIP